jgi:sterol desaturase/sphingolipid hydroxylase (fatty acid hydroxylase superfamily)
MSKITDARKKLRGELEAPPALRRFGSGWISGVLGLVFGVAGLLLVISLIAPGVLAIPETQTLRDNPWYRVAIHFTLIAAFVFSALSLALRRDRILGTCGMAVTLCATFIGGSQATTQMSERLPLFLGLDFFVLNVLFTGLLFIPLERIFAHRNEQPIFREEWREDLFYYLVSSLMVQVLTFLTFLPAKSILVLAPLTELRAHAAKLPFVVQLIVIMILTDLVQYWVHRAFHRVPWLWKFHSVHHSARTMDWMAGARMHFMEIVALRGMTVIPMYVLGFSPAAINTYVLVVYLYSTFVHANLGWRFPLVEKILVTPRFHHWHHGIEQEAVDVNFSIHFPFLDWIFGTYHLPKDRWPSEYGLPGHPVPLGYVPQLKYPFQRPPKTPPAES